MALALICASTLNAFAQKDISTKRDSNLSAQAEKSSNFDEGVLYLHSYRGDLKFTLHGKEISMKAGDLIPAKDFAFEAGDGARISIALSNRVSFYVEGPAKMKIKEFGQVQPFRSFLTDERESTRSKLKLFLEEGKFYFAKLPSRPTSLFEIETPQGSIDPRGTSFIFVCKKNENSVTFVEGQGIIRASGSEKEKFVQAGQTAFLKKIQESNYVDVELRQTPVTLEQRYSDELKVSRFVLASIEFFFAGEKNIRARKLILPDFFLGDAAYTR